MSRESKPIDRSKSHEVNPNQDTLRILLDESTDPIFSFERDGTYRYANWALARAFGKKPEEVIGSKIWDYFPREEADRRFALVKHVFESGETGTIEGVVPQPAPQKDLYFLTSAKPVFALNGHVDTVICVSKDITERKQMEDALRASEAKFRQLIDYAPIPIAWADPQGKMEYINQAFLARIGYELKDIPTLKDWFLKAYPDPEKHDQIKENWAEDKQRAALKQGGTFTHQVVLTCKDGRLRSMQVANSIINGYAYAMFIDVTEQIQAEETMQQLNGVLEARVLARTLQLEQVNRELESFSYSVSHDLRTPLRAIDGFTHILSEDFYPHLPAEGRQVCDAILRNTRRMSQLIDDLLAFSRLSRTEMRQVPVDMRGLADLAFDELTTPENRKHIVFNLQPLPFINGDPSLIRQVWLNLMSNAIKFSSHRPQAHIEVGFTPAESEIIYYIRDDGDGFDMLFADKLFGVFQRLHGIKDFEGTGVGLAIVKRVIQRHGGRVWAEGKPDAGATFYFALPQNALLSPVKP